MHSPIFYQQFKRWQVFVMYKLIACTKSTVGEIQKL